MHEVRNVIAFKQHKEIDADGNAKYPLPLEGQDRIKASGSGKPSHPPKPVKYWEEGWYIWASKSYRATQEKLTLMAYDLPGQKRAMENRQKHTLAYKEFQEFLKKRNSGVPVDRHSFSTSVPHDELQNTKWWGPAIPQRVPDLHKLACVLSRLLYWLVLIISACFSELSILMHAVTPFPPLYKQVEMLLEPTHKLLSICRESVESGTQKKFWLRVWDKAWTKDPFILAGRTAKWSYEKWKDGPPESEPKA